MSFLLELDNHCAIIAQRHLHVGHALDGDRVVHVLPILAGRMGSHAFVETVFVHVHNCLNQVAAFAGITTSSYLVAELWQQRGATGMGVHCVSRSVVSLTCETLRYTLTT